MLHLPLNVMDLMPAPSSNAFPSLSPLCRACSPPPTLLRAPSQPPSAQGSCHPRGPVSSRTRSQSGTSSSQGNRPLPDDDQVVFRERLDTAGDPKIDPQAIAMELEGRRISPIGSRRGSSKTCPPSPAVSSSAYFPPPGLVKGEPPSVLPERPTSRAASAPPSTHPQLSSLLDPTLSRGIERGPEECVECRLAEMSLEEFEDKSVSMSQIRKLPTDKHKNKRPGPRDNAGPYSRTIRDVLREQPYFGSYPCPIECSGSRCANCAFLRFGGNLLAAKIGQRTTNARLLRVTPQSDWPYVEDKDKVLALREAYRSGLERALKELSSQKY
ncbi:hypothetical protein C8T65DRAFT_739368 [Cerioporus squamosus]|nr:hypothetical protein C8T65DRAFT_739368 [Cerioporus squamosus]